jgi:hypothetical protein
VTPEVVFAVCTYGVLPAWLLLVIAPGWRGTQWVVHAVFLPALFGLVYGAALASASAAPDGASFGSLGGVMLLFTVPEAALAGWVHYLVFDLFVGAWEVRDARRRGIPHPWVVPCVALTLMLGPLGLLLYLALRFVRTRALLLDETA